MIGIYKITSPTGKVYIGQSWVLDKRIKKYKHCSVTQGYIYNSLNKYGWDNHKFEIVHELPSDVTQSVLDTYEIFYWQQYKDCGVKMLNIKEPGSGGKHSEETKLKIGIAATGRKHSKESIEKRASKRRGSTISEETKKKISMKNTGRVLGEEARRKISENSKGNKYGLGFKQSKETIENRRIKHIGRKNTTETKLKMSESAKRVWKKRRELCL